MRTPKSWWVAQITLLLLVAPVVLGTSSLSWAAGMWEQGPCGERIDRTPVPSSWERIGVIETTKQTTRRAGRICVWQIDTVRYREVKSSRHTSWHRKLEYTLVSVASKEAQPDQKRLAGGIEENVTGQGRPLDWIPKAVDWIIGHIPDGARRLEEALSFSNEMRKVAEEGVQETLQETSKISDELAPKTPLDVALNVIPFEKGIAFVGKVASIAIKKGLAASGKLGGVAIQLGHNVSKAATEAGEAIKTALTKAIDQFAQSPLGNILKVSPPAYPGHRPIPPGAIVPRRLPTTEMVQGSRRALDDIPKGHIEPNGIWDQAVLQDNPKLSKALDDFAAGKLGKSVKDLDLVDKSPQEIHDLLIQKGFKYKRTPLEAGKDTTGRQLYKKRDGSRTLNPKDPEVLPHDIYTHQDGGSVRVKPEGDPGNPNRAEPHVSKSVVYDTRKTDWGNDAFKVTNEGLAVPRAPDQASGMTQAPAGLASPHNLKGYHDTVMGQAHTNLPLAR